MQSFANFLSQGITIANVGTILLVGNTSKATAKGVSYFGSRVNSISKAAIGEIREMINEKTEDMLLVANNDETSQIKQIYSLEGLQQNKQTSHCKALIKITSNNYVSFEVTSGKQSGVIAKKEEQLLSGETICCNKIQLQLVKIVGQRDHSQDRKQIGSINIRKRSIQDIESFAIKVFQDETYDWLLNNCQNYLQQLIDFAASDY
ncbi:UNKNOWN [Stylonychia lemnae]|uniref:Uncharacterized protein n=1 Tax=Stylonychia lemnae TaxID=5949 RepID=A0A078AEW1_STYLE|nr:UNKNOWN [Stylonychia lemnae]|eukprot:CDW80361.1 UNKNOWN [Stylonychia lemnae]